MKIKSFFSAGLIAVMLFASLSTFAKPKCVPQKWEVGTSMSLTGSSAKGIAQAREAGFQWLEVGLPKAAIKNTPEKNMEWAYRVLDSIKFVGKLKVWSCHMPFGKEYDYSTMDLAHNAVALEQALSYVKIVKTLGAQIAVVHSSSEPVLDNERSERIKIFRENLKVLAAAFKAEGIRVAVEDLPRTCLGNTSGELMQIIDGIDNVGICFDSNHMLKETPEAFVKVCGKKIITTHFSDYDFINERHWTPYLGKIDWPQVVAALVDANYQGIAMFEVSSRPVIQRQDNPVQTCEEVMASWKRMVKEYCNGAKPKVAATPRTVKFAICADVHKDFFPGAEERIAKFMKAAKDNNVDFIIHCGDFAQAKPANQEFFDTWNSYKKAYHVIGNHDVEKNSKEDFMRMSGMKDRYYSFEMPDYYFIVLDLNNLKKDGQIIPYDNGNYKKEKDLQYLDKEQLEWLRKEISRTDKPVILFSHQRLHLDMKDTKEFDDMMKLMNKWGKKVIAAFAGHDHLDFVTEKNGVQHIQINSMAYCWPGKGYENLTRFPTETYEKYYILKYMWPYSDAIYGIVELDPVAREIRIKGTKAEWMPPTPEAMGAKPDPRRTSQVSDRLLKY